MSLLDRLPNTIAAIDHIVRTALASEFWHLRETIQSNVFTVSKIDPKKPTSKQPIVPKECKDEAPAEIAEKYLTGTPFLKFSAVRNPVPSPYTPALNICMCLAAVGTARPNSSKA